jgi:hypothetical protein
MGLDHSNGGDHWMALTLHRIVEDPKIASDPAPLAKTSGGVEGLDHYTTPASRDKWPARKKRSGEQDKDRQTDGWENQRQFFIWNLLEKDIFTGKYSK